MNIKRQYLFITLVIATLIIAALLMFRSCGANQSAYDDEPQPKGTFLDKIFSRESRIYDNGMTDTELSAEERAENEREISLMRKALPGNSWIPYDMNEDEQKAQREQMKESIMLENKMRRSTATREEQRRYYELQIKSTQDRIDLLKYYMQRTSELKEETGKEYYTEDDLVVGEEAIEEFQSKIEDYRKKLDELK